MFNFNKKYFLVLGAFLFSGFSINAVPPREVPAESLTEGQVCLACQEKKRPLVMAFECNNPSHSVCKQCLEQSCLSSVIEFVDSPVELKCSACRAKPTFNNQEFVDFLLGKCSTRVRAVITLRFPMNLLLDNPKVVGESLSTLYCIYSELAILFVDLLKFLERNNVGGATLRAKNEYLLSRGVITPAFFLQKLDDSQALSIIASELLRQGKKGMERCSVVLRTCSLEVSRNILLALSGQEAFREILPKIEALRILVERGV